MNNPTPPQPDDVHLLIDTVAGEAIGVRARLDENDGAHMVYRLDIAGLSLDEPAARPPVDRDHR